MISLIDKILISILVVTILVYVTIFIVYFKADAKNITTNQIWVFLTSLCVVFFICAFLTYTNSYTKKPVKTVNVVTLPDVGDRKYNRFKVAKKNMIRYEREIDEEEMVCGRCGEARCICPVCGKCGEARCVCKTNCWPASGDPEDDTCEESQEEDL